MSRQINRYSGRQWAVGVCCALLACFFSLRFNIERGVSTFDEREGDWYLGYAFNLVEGRGYRDCTLAAGDFHCTRDNGHLAYRLPGYPVYLAVNLLFFGTEQPLAPLRLMQSILAGLIVLQTAMLGARLGGAPSAWLAGLLMASNWLLHEMASVLMTEVFFTFVLLAASHLLLKARQPWAVFWAGAAWAAVLLTRGILLFAMPLLMLFCLRPRHYAPFVLGLLLPICLWTARNAYVLGAFIPFSSGSGTVLWGANNPVTYGLDPPAQPSGDWLDSDDLPGWERFAPSEFADEALHDTLLKAEARRFMSAQPLKVHLRVAMAKLGFWFSLHSPWDSRAAPGSLFLLISVMAAGVATFSGVWRSRITALVAQPVMRLSAALLIGSVLNTLLFYGFWRFRFPLDPFLLTAVAGLVAAAGHGLTWQQVTRPLILAVLLTAVLAVVNVTLSGSLLPWPGWPPEPLDLIQGEWASLAVAALMLGLLTAKRGT